MSNLLLPKATRRAYRGEADLPAIVNLLNRCEAVDQLDTVIVQSKEIVGVTEAGTEAPVLLKM
ncbi:MAG TPA: hypothetical protein V6C46_01845 [Coleofasciculaceae cyanobacterium]